MRVHHKRKLKKITKKDVIKHTLVNTLIWTIIISLPVWFDERFSDFKWQIIAVVCFCSFWFNFFWEFIIYKKGIKKNKDKKEE